MKKIKTNFIDIAVLSAVIIVSASCVNEKHDDQSKQATEQAGHFKADLPYDLSNPVKYNMPENLFEISGIAFHQGDPKTVYAIQDEDGDVFYMGLNEKQSKFTRFGGKGDYEDLTIIQDNIIVLKSNGELHTFPISELGKEEAANVVKTKDLVPKAEYEGIAADEAKGMIYILTKEEKKNKSKACTIYAFKFEQGKFTERGTFDLSYDEIGQLAGESKMKFRPSALTRNSQTGEWYILSSINKLLLVTDADFKPRATYPLKGEWFNQPEGIAFDRDHHLYISNEGGTLAAGNILMFKEKK